MQFHIDSSAIAGHVQVLKELHKSAFPVVVRQTLTKAAKDVKTDTMPKEAQRFASRKPNFFKANSAYTPADGFDIDTMRATVGFKPKSGDKSHAVEDLEQQEHGGEIANRAFIALPGARTSKAWKGMVRKGQRMADIANEIFDANSPNLHGVKNKKEAYILSAIYAKKGGFVMGTDRKNGARQLLRINSVKRIKGDTVVNSTPIYNVKKSREVEPGSKYHNFMHAAAAASQRKMEKDFIILTEKKVQQLIAKRK
jgi:hypothetical protein